MTHFANAAARSLLASFTVSIFGLSGCVMEEVAIDSFSQKVLTENALTENALTENALTENALTENALTENALSEVITTEDGFQLVKYVARCALNEGDTLVITTADGVSHNFPGTLGIAPEWSQGGLTDGKKEAVSACLLAHVNHYQIPVSISARSEQLGTTVEEYTTYEYFEGAFFGNVFGAAQEKYACGGDPIDVNIAPSRADRVCTDVETGDTTFCGFTYVGQCDDVCTPSANGNYLNCEVAGKTFEAPMSVWLAVVTN
jgi:hypothetical protein